MGPLKCLPLSASPWSSGGLSKTNWARNEPGRKNFCCSVNIWVNVSPARRRESLAFRILIFFLYVHPPHLLLCILVSVFLVCSPDHLTSDWPDGFFLSSNFTWIITISFPLLSPVISALPSLPLLPQTAPVSGGESAHLSHSHLLSLSLSLHG